MFSLSKRHKRLVILNKDGEIVYTPPDFMRRFVPSRQELQFVVDKFNAIGQYDIQSIMEFESKFHPNKEMRNKNV